MLGSLTLNSIRFRLLLASTLVQVVLLSLLLFNSVRLMNEATDASVVTLIDQNASMLNAMATAYAQHGEMETLQDVLHELLTDAEEGLIYVRIGLPDGSVLWSAGDEEKVPGPSASEALQSDQPVREHGLIHTRQPLLLDRNEVGFLQFGVSVSALESARRAILLQGSGIALFEILLTFALLSGIGYLMTRNFVRLMQGSEALSQGKLDHRIKVEGRDELAQLSERFNIMADALQARIGELEDTAGRLRVSEERYALAMRGANDGLWDWDIEHQAVFISPRFREIASMPADAELTLDPIHFPNIHPDDVREFKSRLFDHLQGKTEQFEFEFRTLAAGQTRWILARGVALRDAASGRANRIAGSITDIDQRKRAEAQLLHDAFHDKLTRLPNRALFLEHLGYAIRRCSHNSADHFAVLTVNLERFHKVNDSFGHSVGDLVLHELARRLEGFIREGDIAARIGGDQFAVLLNELKDDSQALRLSQELCEALAQPINLDSQPYFPASRIGIVFSSDGAADAEAMLRDADNALHRSGNSSVNVFHASMHTQLVDTLQLEGQLRQAIDNHHITVAYQPIVSLQSGAIISLEALARWEQPGRGWVSPSTFIPIAENLGLIHPLTLGVLDQICRALKQWQNHAHGRPLPAVSINLSARQFSRPGLAAEIIGRIREHGISPAQLRIEVTESALADVPETANRMLQDFRDAGLCVLIDDFGTGYSALSYLHTIPCDIIKFDGSFIRPLNEDAKLRALVRRSIELAHDLGMTVIAECIETEAQARTLLEMQCDFGQGYLYSRPIDADQLERLLFLPAGSSQPGAP